MNYTNTHITDYLPLTASINLPDTRENLDGRTLTLGISDLWTIGDTSNPWITNSYFQYRANPLRTSPSHPNAGIPNTLFNLFDTYTSGDEFGNLGQAFLRAGLQLFQLLPKIYFGGQQYRQTVWPSQCQIRLGLSEFESRRRGAKQLLHPTFRHNQRLQYFWLDQFRY